MIRPRVLPDKPFGTELQLLSKLRLLCAILAKDMARYSAWEERMVASFVRLLQSGVLDERNMSLERVTQMDAVVKETVVRREQAALAAGQLRCCSLASCGSREAHINHFSRCAACKAVFYCGKEHQLADWPAHKKARAKRRAKQPLMQPRQAPHDECARRATRSRTTACIETRASMRPPASTACKRGPA